MREKNKMWSGKGNDEKKKSQVRMRLGQTSRESLLKWGLGGGRSVSTDGFLKAHLAFTLS